MDKNTYLNRINFRGSLKPTIELLQQLQEAHLLHVPFENLDIHYGHPIQLDENKVYKKLINQGRGGFCYELNGLFAELLNHLGFHTKKVSARVYDKTKGYGPEFDHLAIIVNIDGLEYLTDVGFGEFVFAPLKIELNKVQKDKRGDYIIDKHDEIYYRVNSIVNGEKVPEYIFTNTEREWTDFNDMCHYHQSSPNSHFTQKRLISRPTLSGRITITGHTLKIKEKDSIEEISLEDEAMFEHQLWRFFKIKLKK